VKRGSVILVVLAFLSLAGAGLAHVTLRIGVVRLGYDIGKLTSEQQALEAERRELLAERARLRNPERIERIAREVLGMTRPEPEQIRTVKPGVSELARR
jgi:cell division protein FtsL